MKSVMISGIEPARKMANLERQVPGVEGIHSFCGGVHWKIEIKVWEVSAVTPPDSQLCGQAKEQCSSRSSKLQNFRCEA